MKKNVAMDDSDRRLAMLADNIVTVIHAARESVSRHVNKAMVAAYWNVGRYIVEFEQHGNAKSKYGTGLLTNLSKLLSVKLGRGYSRPNLNNMRKFYLAYPICQKVSDKLNWSQICELITISDPLERSFYEKECVHGNWDVVSLRRQMDSGLFLRLAASKDKKAVLALAEHGVVVRQPEDIVKDTYTLEFLGLRESVHFSESELEQRIIDNLQTFLLELGRGFAFVGRQYPITVNNVHYHIDLVFYHRILKCFVLIDLKKGAVKHEDIGQMNMYMGYFAKEEGASDDKPPVGIILSRFKDELLVEYATYGMDANLFVSKYELYLPNREELARLVEKIVGNECTEKGE